MFDAHGVAMSWREEAMSWRAEEDEDRLARSEARTWTPTTWELPWER